MPIPPRNREPFLGDANRAMEENLTRNTRPIVASYGLIGAILLFGAAGYLLDRWLETAPMLLIAGALMGVVVGLVGVYRQLRRE